MWRWGVDRYRIIVPGSDYGVGLRTPIDSSALPFERQIIKIVVGSDKLTRRFKTAAYLEIKRQAKVRECHRIVRTIQ